MKISPACDDSNFDDAAPIVDAVVVHEQQGIGATAENDSLHPIMQSSMTMAVVYKILKRWPV